LPGSHDAPAFNFFNQDEVVIEREIADDKKMDGKGTAIFEKSGLITMTRKSGKV
jgi:hypothetical protein